MIANNDLTRLEESKLHVSIEAIKKLGHTEAERFNGHENRETWSFSLYFGGDATLTELAYEAKDLWEAETNIKEFIEELFDWGNVRESEKLFNILKEIGSLDRINWNSVAKDCMELAEEIKAEEIKEAQNA